MTPRPGLPTVPGGAQLLGVGGWHELGLVLDEPTVPEGTGSMLRQSGGVSSQVQKWVQLKPNAAPIRERFTSRIIWKCDARSVARHEAESLMIRERVLRAPGI